MVLKWSKSCAMASEVTTFPHLWQTLEWRATGLLHEKAEVHRLQRCTVVRLTRALCAELINPNTLISKTNTIGLEVMTRGSKRERRKTSCLHQSTREKKPQDKMVYRSRCHWYYEHKWMCVSFKTWMLCLFYKQGPGNATVNTPGWCSATSWTISVLWEDLLL